jgi:hypothetical protein
MGKTGAVFAPIAVLVAIGISPAAAGDWRGDWYSDWPYPIHRRHDRAWHASHRLIYEQQKRIAFREADPDEVDAFRAPLITRARAEIRRHDASLPPPEWRWAVSCCYSRPPVHLR